LLCSKAKAFPSCNINNIINIINTLIIAHEAHKHLPFGVAQVLVVVVAVACALQEYTLLPFIYV